MYTPRYNLLFISGGILCIVHGARARCLLRSTMILFVPSMPGNAPAAGKCLIPQFLRIGRETIIHNSVSSILGDLFVLLQGNLFKVPFLFDSEPPTG